MLFGEDKRTSASLEPRAIPIEQRCARGPRPDSEVIAGGGQSRDPGPIWPLGLGIDVALGVGAAVVTIRRLRMPARKLARGVRVA